MKPFSGHVNGTLSSGSRNADIDETFHNPLVAAHFDQLHTARIEVTEHHEGSISSTFEDIVNTVITWVVGSIAISPVTGLIIFVGVGIGSLISTGSFAPGARIIAGSLWLAGPSGTLYALIAEGISALGTRTRDLSQEEYDFANNVFAGSLPPRENLILTDTIGGGNRAFTFPRFDGKITINMGPDAFNDPRTYQTPPNGNRIKGEIFIHELVHAWQIHHTRMDISLLADAFASKVCEAGGGNPYEYGPEGPAFGDFNLEQQASIVADWFAGRAPGSGGFLGGITRQPQDTSSPYFRYIEHNIRVGAI
jgi:hypothetical protein